MLCKNDTSLARSFAWRKKSSAVETFIAFVPEQGYGLREGLNSILAVMTSPTRGSSSESQATAELMSMVRTSFVACIWSNH
jgi:hypothetical protein